MKNVLFVKDYTIYIEGYRKVDAKAGDVVEVDLALADWLANAEVAFEHKADAATIENKMEDAPANKKKGK